MINQRGRCVPTILLIFLRGTTSSVEKSSRRTLKPEAEKYHMRGWLLRLGFGGPANAGVRKVLLGHLAGCSAFPNAEQAKRHADKYAAIRKEQRETAHAAAEATVAAPIQEPMTTAETAPAERTVKPDVKEVAGLE